MSTTPTPVDRLVAHHRAFLDFLTKRVGDRALAEDILQEAFVRGIDKVDQLRDEESSVAWFYRSLRNAVTDHHRRQGSRTRALDGLARELEIAGPEVPEFKDAACRCVVDLATDLDPTYADALQQIDVEGASVKDYATRVGITPNNAGVRVFRARKALRSQVRRACGTCAEHGCVDCTCGRP